MFISSDSGSTISTVDRSSLMIIGITGLIGSGKDTAANYLITHHQFKKESFANSLKDAVAAVFGWDRELLEGQSKYSREWREQKDVWWSERLGQDITPRWVLQYWGTEVLRNRFHDDIWVASLENKLRNSRDDIVITDCRFPNEIDAIKNAGGFTLRINRGPNPEWYDDAVAFTKGPSHIGWAIGKFNLHQKGVHASEYSSVGLDYDYQIDNNGTIVDLHEQLAKILEEINGQLQDRHASK